MTQWSCADASCYIQNKSLPDKFLELVLTYSNILNFPQQDLPPYHFGAEQAPDNPLNVYVK